MSKYTKVTELVWKYDALSTDAVEIAKQYAELPWVLRLLIPRSIRRIIVRLAETIDEMTD
jgi:hypothetical protein